MASNWYVGYALLTMLVFAHIKVVLIIYWTHNKVDGWAKKTLLSDLRNDKNHRLENNTATLYGPMCGISLYSADLNCRYFWKQYFVGQQELQITNFESRYCHMSWSIIYLVEFKPIEWMSHLLDWHSGITLQLTLSRKIQVNRNPITFIEICCSENLVLYHFKTCWWRKLLEQ